MHERSRVSEIVEAQNGSQELHLLVPSLHAAVALVQVRHVAMRIRDDLHLDVPRPLHVALDQHTVVAKCSRRLALCRLKRRLQATTGQGDHICVCEQRPDTICSGDWD